MFKKIGIILFFAAVVEARHAVPLQGLLLLSDTAFADSYTQNGQPCPPECVTDSLEMITYYPSPYGYYEELRGDKIIVGDSDNSYINETDLPPTGTITFEPVSYASVSVGTNLYEGTMYYDKDDHKFRYYDNTGSDSTKYWKDLGGGAVRLENYATSSLPACSNAILGTLIYNTTEKRPYVCALNASNSPVWKPLDSDYDKDGVTDRIDTNDQNFNDATATEADVLQGKTFYAGGQARTGTMPDPHACDTLGGSWVSSQNTCYFSGTSCKTGWSPNQSYSTTQYSYCKVYNSCEASTDSCTTGSHNRANAGIESCGYKYLSGDFCLNATCYATQTEIGCKKN